MSSIEEEFDRYVNKVNCPIELKQKYLLDSGFDRLDDVQDHIASFFYTLGYYNAIKNLEKIKREELHDRRKECD